MDEGIEQPGLPDMQKGKVVCCARIIVTAVTLFGSAPQGDLMKEREQRGLLPVSGLESQSSAVKTWLQRAANNMTACHL